jgi:hypothetical protein
VCAKIQKHWEEFALRQKMPIKSDEQKPTMLRYSD